MNHPKMIAALGAAVLLAAAPASAQQVLDTDEAEIDVPEHPFGEVGAPGLGADRDVAPESTDGDEFQRGLDEQLSTGTVDDQQVLPGSDEDELSGAGVGLRENEGTIGTTDQIGDPPAGFGGLDSDRSIMSDDGL